MLWGWIDFLVLCHLQALLGFEGSHIAKKAKERTILRFETLILGKLLTRMTKKFPHKHIVLKLKFK